MYSACTLEDIHAVIDLKPEQYFEEREELADLEEDEDTRYYASEDCLLIVSPGRRQTNLYAIPLKKDFDLAQLESFAKKMAEAFEIHLHVTGIEAEALRFSEPYQIGDVVTSYSAAKWVAPGEQEPRPIGKIRDLTRNDERHAKYFQQKDHGSFMGLQQTFSLLVEDESGTVMGYFTPDGTLKGYLSYLPNDLGPLVLDDLYVQPTERGKGIEVALAREFLRRATNAGTFAYWPVVASEEAKETAEAAGFTLVAARMTIGTID